MAPVDVGQPPSVLLLLLLLLLLLGLALVAPPPEVLVLPLRHERVHLVLGRADSGVPRRRRGAVPGVPPHTTP